MTSPPPPPPLFTVTDDIARQSTLTGGMAALAQRLADVMAAVATLSGKVDILMSEDALAGSQIADIDAKMGLALTALGSMQDLFTALQAEVSAGTLSQGTRDALAKAQADAAALADAAQADVAADTPAPSNPPVTGQ